MYLYVMIQIPLQFVPKGQIDIESILVEIAAWYQTCDKPFYFLASYINWLMQERSNSIANTFLHIPIDVILKIINITKPEQSGPHFVEVSKYIR